MDFSLNIISLEKKLRFYCGDEIYTYDAVPSNLKNELWWNEKSHQKAINEMISELKVICKMKNITIKQAQKHLYGIEPIKVN
jgi:hypothetical protein